MSTDNALKFEGEPPALFSHEWVSILTITLIFLGLACLSLLEDGSSIDTSVAYIPKPTITVIVSGAVAHPGNYTVPRGTLLKEVLQQAVPLASANLERLNQEQPLQRKRKVHVPVRRMKN